MRHIQELIDLITLKKTVKTPIKAKTSRLHGRVFGQVLSQSLNAAYQTVADDRLHILFTVILFSEETWIANHLWGGHHKGRKSFTTRRVVAFQEGRLSSICPLLFNCFNKELNIKTLCLIIFLPKTFEWSGAVGNAKIDPEVFKRFKKIKPEVIEFRPLEKLTLREINAWQRAIIGFVPKSPLLYNAASASAVSLYFTMVFSEQPLYPIKKNCKSQTFLYRLDHAMWFHRPFF